jgi:hypothetical protein
MSNVRRCRDDERGAILAIVNAAAQVYRSVIPADDGTSPTCRLLSSSRGLLRQQQG